MQKPQQRLVRRKPRSLKEIAILKQLESVSSKAQLEQVLKKNLADLRCEIIKKSLHKTYLSQTDLLQLIKEYCDNNTLLRAYAYYTHITSANRKININLLGALAEYEEANLVTAKAKMAKASPEEAKRYEEIIQISNETIALIDALITAANESHLGISLIEILINNNDFKNIQSLLELGERPRTLDLMLAISEGQTDIAQLLLEWGVKVDDPVALVNDQPLFQAFSTLNEPLIKTLLLNGASLVRKYNSEGKIMSTIPDDLRLFIKTLEENNLPMEGKSMEQTNAYLEKLKNLLNTYAPVKKFNRLSA